MCMASHAFLKINTETFKEFSVLSRKTGKGTLRGFLLGICFFTDKSSWQPCGCLCSNISAESALICIHILRRNTCLTLSLCLVPCSHNLCVMHIFYQLYPYVYVYGWCNNRKNMQQVPSWNSCFGSSVTVRGHDLSTVCHSGTLADLFTGAKYSCWALNWSLCSVFPPPPPPLCYTLLYDYTLGWIGVCLNLHLVHGRNYFDSALKPLIFLHAVIVVLWKNFQYIWNRKEST